MDRRKVDGRKMDGRQVDGRKLDGRQVNGKHVDGRKVDEIPNHLDKSWTIIQRFCTTNILDTNLQQKQQKNLGSKDRAV